jgi:protein-L-isoaspartate O-methyltransferase
VTGRRTARCGLLCLVSLLPGASVIAGPAAHADPKSPVLETWRIVRDGRRFEILDRQALWDVLAIKPGMTVLDIGTGTGQFAYAFAERVQGQGKVYATDINNKCVKYVAEQAAERKLRHIFPVLVKNDALDEFYRTARYDLIAMFHVLMDYEKKVDFLSYLRGSLADDGRLVLIIAKEFPDFSVHDFTDDHDGLVKQIMQEPPGNPFYRAFRESTRALLRASSGTAFPESIIKVIAEDFNIILANANFGMDFFDGSAFRKDLDFTREERDYADWLTIPNKLRIMSEGAPNTSWIAGRKAKIINKLLIIQKYRKYLRNTALYTPGLSPAGREAFARAGYVLHKEYADLIPFEDVVVFHQERLGTDFKSVPRSATGSRD